MKSHLRPFASICGCLLLILCLPGCKTGPDKPPPNAFLIAVAGEAAYLGTAIDLQKNPAHRPYFDTTKLALDRLINDGTWDPVAFRLVLARLTEKVGPLRGETGAIALDAALLLFTTSTGYVDLEKSPQFRAYVIAIRDGLARGLTGAVPRARQLTLPPR